jgi:predicted nuclease of predicted toxin-antitoxin system
VSARNIHIWLDAHLSPDIAAWIHTRFGIAAASIIELGLHQSRDREVFERAKTVGAVLMTKDADFVELVERFGPPPKVIHLTCGNTSNSEMRRILEAALPAAIDHLAGTERLVEIGRKH